MKEIKEIIDNKLLTKDCLIRCFELVQQNGDVLVVKSDGQRTENSYTLFITFPENKAKDMLRIDCDDLQDGLYQLLNKYCEA